LLYKAGKCRRVERVIPLEVGEREDENQQEKRIELGSLGFSPTEWVHINNHFLINHVN